MEDMHSFLLIVAASAAMLTGAAGVASADPHDSHRDDRKGHDRGERGD